MHVVQQLKLWKAQDFSGKSFFICFKRLMHFFKKPGLGISCKKRKHMFTDTFLVSFLRMPWSSHSCNDHRYSYFTRNICNRYADCFKTLFRTWSQACFLRLSRLLLDGDPAWISCGLYFFCHLDISVESIGRFICHQDQSNEKPLFIRPQFGSQFGVFYLFGFIKPMQHFNRNVFLYTPFKMLCQQWIIKGQASDKNTPCS